MLKNEMPKNPLFLPVALTVAALLSCTQVVIDYTDRHLKAPEVIGAVGVLLAVFNTWRLEFRIRRSETGQDPDSGPA